MNRDPSIFRRALRQTGALLVAALIPALLAAAFHPRRPAWSPVRAEALPVTWSQVAGWRGRVLFVDARGEGAFAQRHIPGALPLREAQWEALLPAVLKAWQPGARVVVYCDNEGCDTSQAVASRLRRELGLDTVFVLKGGWNSWLEAQPR
jgi:rhodanese-related sulfurtransferase